MNLKDYCEVCHGIAKEKGFWDVDRNDAEMIALMHSELSEALEAMRTNNWNEDDGVAEELADCIIRICDFCGGRNLNLEKALLDKIEKNRNRPYKHNKKF